MTCPVDNCGLSSLKVLSQPLSVIGFSQEKGRRLFGQSAARFLCQSGASEVLYYNTDRRKGFDVSNRVLRFPLKGRIQNAGSAEPLHPAA